MFNGGAPDERLREEDCRANVIHTAPSRAMLADGLAEYLIWKQWRKWLLVVGSHPDDIALGAAYERAAKKFGAKIVEKRTFEDTGGGRRSDSGVVQTQRQMPVFTQNAPDYDVLIAADENEVFGGYLPYRTWDPRPVAGSGGLQPTSWDASHELWGAQQLQNRFQRMFHRGMTARDNQAWVAMRMIGDAVNRTKTADPRSRARHDALARFRRRRFQGREADAKAVEPAASPADPLTDGRGTVSVSPQEGFLHQVSELDTLGLDQPETKCKLHVSFAGALALMLAAASPALANTAYITNEKGNSVSVIDTASIEVTKTIKVGQRPRGVALSKDERFSSSAPATTTRSRSSTRRP